MYLEIVVTITALIGLWLLYGIVKVLGVVTINQVRISQATNENLVGIYRAIQASNKTQDELLKLKKQEMGIKDEPPRRYY